MKLCLKLPLQLHSRLSIDHFLGDILPPKHLSLSQIQGTKSVYLVHPLRKLFTIKDFQQSEISFG